MDALKMIFWILVVAALAFLAFAIIYSSPRSNDANVLVFAYGNQLPSATFSSRSGGFVGASPARLGGFRLEFATNRGTEFGVASLVEDSSSAVAGAAYELSSGQATALEGRLGSEGFYQKIPVRPRLANGTQVDAQAFVLSGNTVFAPPSRPAMDAAAKGLEEFGFGENERQQLASAAERAALGCISPENQKPAARWEIRSPKRIATTSPTRR